MLELRSHDGSRLDLRSQVFFVRRPSPERSNLVDLYISWGARRINECAPWTRLHGSTVGVLLTSLRHARDQLAYAFFGSLDPRDARRLDAQRRQGRALLEGRHSPDELWLGREQTIAAHHWLTLKDAYELIWDAGPRMTARIAAPGAGDTVAHMDTALELMRVAMADRCAPDWNAGGGAASVSGAVVIPAFEGRTLSTRTLIESATAFDDQVPESLGFKTDYADGWRPQRAVADRDHHRLRRLADHEALRYVDTWELLALIDFALNPPVPGLTADTGGVSFEELHPPARFHAACAAMATFDSPLRSAVPSVDLLTEFMQEITDRTGLRYGVIRHRLGRTDSLDEAVASDSSLGPSDVVSEVLFHTADRLHRTRDTHPERISHFGLNFINAQTTALIDRTHPDFQWWFQPLLRVADGTLFAPEMISAENCSELITWTAVTGAFDDALSGVGDLSTDHLPRVEKGSERATTIEEITNDLTGLRLSWAW